MNSSTNMKEQYEKFCQRKELSLFAQPFWLDVVCEDAGNWDVALVIKGSEVQAALPYFLKNQFGHKIITMPPLCQVMGPYFVSTRSSIQKQLQREKELTIELIASLPSHAFFKQNFHHSIEYWLPWHWQGFSQTTRYTYRIEDTSDIDVLWKNLSGNIRKEIKKAKSRFGIQIHTDFDGESMEEFIALNIKTYSRQKQKLPYPKKMLHRLDKATSERKCRKIFIARDAEGAAHAGIYLVWDQTSIYYLMGGGDPDLRKSGATSLLMWEGIKLAHQQKKTFDFEGSMIEPIEKFFRAFGGKPTPYFQITKTNNSNYAALTMGKNLLRFLTQKKR